MGLTLAAEAARKIYVLPPLGGWKCAGGVIYPGEALYFLDGNQWSYRYVYRNSITGHVSDATPDIKRIMHTFGYPENDVLDVYRQDSKGAFEWYRTVEGYKG
jgi:hypothetical protein